jgi:hypothetical protein
MQLRSLLPILILLSLAACDEGSDLTEDLCPRASAESTTDTLLAARINGREFQVGPVDGPTIGAGVYSSGISGGLSANPGEGFLGVYGTTQRLDTKEHLEVVLFGFTGVGAYPLDWWSTADPGSGYVAYDCMTSLGSDRTYWLGTSADTAWVTAFDSASGEIEGRFAISEDPSGEGEVVVTEGLFRGVARR